MLRGFSEEPIRKPTADAVELAVKPRLRQNKSERRGVQKPRDVHHAHVARIDHRIPPKLPPFGHGPRVRFAASGTLRGPRLSDIPCGFAVLISASKVFLQLIIFLLRQPGGIFNQVDRAVRILRLIVPSGFRGAPEARSSAIISGEAVRDPACFSNFTSTSGCNAVIFKELSIYLPLFSDCDWISGASHGCICTGEAKKSQVKQPEGGKYVRHEQHHSRDHRHGESRTQ